MKFHFQSTIEPEGIVDESEKQVKIPGQTTVELKFATGTVETITDDLSVSVQPLSDVRISVTSNGFRDEKT